MTHSYAWQKKQWLGWKRTNWIWEERKFFCVNTQITHIIDYGGSDELTECMEWSKRKKTSTYRTGINYRFDVLILHISFACVHWLLCAARFFVACLTYPHFIAAEKKEAANSCVNLNLLKIHMAICIFRLSIFEFAKKAFYLFCNMNLNNPKKQMSNGCGVVDESHQMFDAITIFYIAQVSD